MAIQKLILSVVIVLALLVFGEGTMSAASAPTVPFKLAIVMSTNKFTSQAQRDVKCKKLLLKSLKHNVATQTYYLDYNSRMTEERLQENAEKTYARIHKFKPDLVLVYGDVAFEQVAVRYLYPNNIKTAFFNVWKENFDIWMTQYKLDRFSGAMAGVLTMGNVPKITSIMDALDLNYLYVIKNDHRYFSVMVRSIYEHVKNRKVETTVVTSLNGLSKAVRDIGTKPKGLILLMITDLTDVDGGVALPGQISNVLTTNNKQNFEMSYTNDYAKYGTASSLMMNDLSRREPLDKNNYIITDLINNNKAIITTTTNELVVNVDRTTALGFDRLLLMQPPLFDGISDDLF
jgi:hypothetical protein